MVRQPVIRSDASIVTGRSGTGQRFVTFKNRYVTYLVTDYGSVTVNINHELAPAIYSTNKRLRGGMQRE